MWHATGYSGTASSNVRSDRHLTHPLSASVSSTVIRRPSATCISYAYRNRDLWYLSHICRSIKNSVEPWRTHGKFVSVRPPDIVLISRNCWSMCPERLFLCKPLYNVKRYPGPPEWLISIWTMPMLTQSRGMQVLHNTMDMRAFKVLVKPRRCGRHQQGTLYSMHPEFQLQTAVHIR
jgi:hypothetical protein